MKHLIFTKFNLPDGTGRHVNEAWLEDRIELFEKWTLPSIKAQTAQDFTWLLSFSDKTPKKFMDKFKSYESDNVKSEFIKGSAWVDVLANWYKMVQGYIEPGRILTTRIDSDDAIKTDYIKKVREIAKPGIWVGFNHGWMCKDGKVYLRQYNRNPFLTYCENVSDVSEIETVHKYKHCEVPAIAYVETSEPGWIQHAHENTGWNKDTIREKDMLSNWIPLEDVKGDFGL
jgi:hypothetical protein